eukprot:1200423-Amphidinium_carterae.1
MVLRPLAKAAVDLLMVIVGRWASGNGDQGPPHHRCSRQPKRAPAPEAEAQIKSCADKGRKSGGT